MVFKLQSGHDFVTETATYKVQRGITKTIYIQELWFLRSVYRLMLVNISLTFHDDILDEFQVTELTALYSVHGIAKIQRGITQNNYIQELWFLRSAHRLMLVNISMTFHEDILGGFQVTVLQSRWHFILFLHWHFLRTIVRQQGDYRTPRKSLSRLTTSREIDDSTTQLHRRGIDVL